MNYDDILALVRAGYSKAEIDAMGSGAAAPAPCLSLVVVYGYGVYDCIWLSGFYAADLVEATGLDHAQIGAEDHGI